MEASLHANALRRAPLFHAAPWKLQSSLDSHTALAYSMISLAICYPLCVCMLGSIRGGSSMGTIALRRRPQMRVIDLKNLLRLLNTDRQAILLSQSLSAIDAQYHVIPRPFAVGREHDPTWPPIRSAAGENMISAKIL